MTISNQQSLLELAAEKFRLGELPEADKICRAILRSDPSNVLAMNLLAGILRQLRQMPEAIEIMEMAVNLAQTVPELRVNCGDLWAELSELDRAVECYQKAISLKPAYSKAWFQCGLALRKLRRQNDAIACFEHVLKMLPNNLPSMLQLADIAHEQSRTTIQLQYAEAALRIDPRNQLARKMRVSAWFNEGRISDAIVEYRELLKESPSDIAIGSNLMISLCYDPHISPESLLKEHQSWAAAAYPASFAKYAVSTDVISVKNRPLRVGYVSPDFRDHAVSKFLRPVIAHHDVSRFEIFCYSSGNLFDAVTEWYKSHCSTWRNIAVVSTVEALKVIQNDKIDILVDLAGHTRGHRLDVFARKAAPLQVTWLGYPSTTGLGNIDYLISDEIIDPPGISTHTSESIWRLSRPFCVMEKQLDIAVQNSPAILNGYVTFGSMHALAKLNDDVIDLWCQILQKVPSSRLLVYRSSLLPAAQPTLRQRFMSHGLSDTSRLVLAYEKPRSGTHLEIYNHIDIHLDCFPWNGHTTTCEALWMGVPTITILGDRHSGRMSASMLHSLKLDRFVANSAAEAVAIASETATDIAALADLRKRLRSELERSTLMDAVEFTRCLETAYLEMWQKKWNTT